jgi:hypothetical protein
VVGRVKIQGGASSPFRVSVATVDVATADFDQLIFDGNQQPFRIWSTNYIAADLIPYGTAGLAMPTKSTLQTYACPAGQFPMFNIMYRIPDGSPSDVLRTPRSIGGMIDAADRYLYALSFGKQSGPTTISYAYCNYLIYRNYG